MVFDNTYVIKHYTGTSIADFGLEPGNDFRRVMSWFPTISRIPIIMAAATYDDSEKPVVIEPGCGSAFLGPMFLDKGFQYLGVDGNSAQIEIIKNSGFLTDKNIKSGNVSDLSKLIESSGYSDIDLVYNSFMPENQDWTSEIADIKPKAIVFCYQPLCCGTDKSYGEIEGFDRVHFDEGGNVFNIPIFLPNDIYWGLEGNQMPIPSSGGQMSIYFRSDIGYDPLKFQEKVIQQVKDIKDKNLKIPWEEELIGKLQ